MRIEDLYDVPPPEVRLIGGSHAGRRMTWTEPLPVVLVLPPHETLEERLDRWAICGPPPLRTVTDRAEVYQNTGRIDDDGTRVYAFTA